MNAMMALANHYAKPDIDDPNNKSITWFAHAAMGGNQTAQETLGFSMMETGYIKEMQPYIAFLEAAQKHGHPDASYLLARHYRAASGVKRNLKKAKAILNKVAHLDDPRITEEIQIVEDHIIYFSGKIPAVLHASSSPIKVCAVTAIIGVRRLPNFSSSSRISCVA